MKARRQAARLLAGALALAAAGLRADPGVLNVRDFGAIGDGRFHSVEEWRGTERDRAVARALGDIPLGRRWSVDEAAFDLAKGSLPAGGGTIRFPAGVYLATGDSWRILRDHVTLAGEGAERSILETGPGVEEGLVLSGYRHVGWSGTHPISAADGARGTTRLRLTGGDEPGWAKPGTLVFVRDGANRFDQDYGEFNEVARSLGGGLIELTTPLARDYRPGSGNSGSTLRSAFALPRVGSAAEAQFGEGPREFLPSAGDEVTVAGNLLRVLSAGAGGRVRLENPGRGNDPAGTVLAAGAPVMKARGLVVLSATTRDFACSGLTIRGRRKALDLSNSFASTFTRCVIERIPGEAPVRGGIVIDGDGGRFARFTDCTIRAEPACGMQFARSFGDVAFDRCRFMDANVVFSEFCFNASVTDCAFEVRGGPMLRQVIIAGHSCDSIRISGNSIRASAVASVFDGVTDIQSFTHSPEGGIVLTGNSVEVAPGIAVFSFGKRTGVTLADTTVNGRRIASGPGAPGDLDGAFGPGGKL